MDIALDSKVGMLNQDKINDSIREGQRVGAATIRRVGARGIREGSERGE